MQQNEGVSPPGREQLPTCSSYCIQLTLHWLLQQLHLQIKCFTYIWYFPLPSTLRPKFILQAHKVLCFDLQNFLLKRKPAAGLCLKNKCNLLPPQKKCIVKQSSLWAENFATEDDKGSMRSDLTTADPHSQNTNGGKGQLLMERMAPAVPEVMLGDYTWLV